jgi:hypothetical protein
MSLILFGLTSKIFSNKNNVCSYLDVVLLCSICLIPQLDPIAIQSLMQVGGIHMGELSNQFIHHESGPNQLICYWVEELLDWLRAGVQ